MEAAAQEDEARLRAVQALSGSLADQKTLERTFHTRVARLRFRQCDSLQQAVTERA